MCYCVHTREERTHFGSHALKESRKFWICFHFFGPRPVFTDHVVAQKEASHFKQLLMNEMGVSVGFALEHVSSAQYDTVPTACNEHTLFIFFLPLHRG